jgi:hypothetical protein
MYLINIIEFAGVWALNIIFFNIIWSLTVSIMRRYIKITDTESIDLVWFAINLGHRKDAYWMTFTNLGWVVLVWGLYTIISGRITNIMGESGYWELILLMCIGSFAYALKNMYMTETEMKTAASAIMMRLLIANAERTHINGLNMELIEMLEKQGHDTGRSQYL